MMLVMTEAGLSCSPKPTPPHRHQRTASLSSSTLLIATTSNAVAPTVLAPITVFGRSRSYTDAMLMKDDVNYQRRLSATISEVLHSLSKLSTESSEAMNSEDGNSTTTNHGQTTGVEEVNMNSNSGSSNGFNGDSSVRTSSVDASMAEEASIPPPPASLHTPVMQRQKSLQLSNPPHFPTLKREHSANLSSSMGYNNYSVSTSVVAPSSRHHPHPFTHYGGGSGGSSNKKSRSGSFVMIQSAPHLPLSPELDASRSGGGCRDSPNQGPPGTADESRFLSNAAHRDSLAGAAAATKGPSAGGNAPVIWKSHIQLPPPLFSPMIYQPQGQEADEGSHSAAVAAAANTLAKSLSLHPPQLLQEPQQRDDDFDRWMMGHPPPSTLLPPPLQPDLRSFDEHDDVTPGRGDGPGLRLQQRRRPQLSELSSSLYFPPPPPLASTSGPSASLVLPPPMPLMSSPSPSPKVGPRRILRMRKADAMDLALP